MTPDEMDTLTGDTDNKSEKIRRLHDAGVSTSDISRHLGIAYQHTYNVLKRSDRVGKAGDGDERVPLPASASAGETLLLELGADSGVRLPPAMLEAQGLSPGDRLVCRSNSDGLVIMSRTRAVEYLREIARTRLPGEVDLIEALLGANRTDGKADAGP